MGRAEGQNKNRPSKKPDRGGLGSAARTLVDIDRKGKGKSAPTSALAIRKKESKKGRAGPRWRGKSQSARRGGGPKGGGGDGTCSRRIWGLIVGGVRRRKECGQSGG